jgi:hypothetical protein
LCLASRLQVLQSSKSRVYPSTGQKLANVAHQCAGALNAFAALAGMHALVQWPPSKDFIPGRCIVP